MQHSISCKKGGFVTLRHNEIRDITATLLSEVCKDVECEPNLIPLNGEQSNLNRTSKINNDVRLDVSARGFWISGPTAFMGIRVFDPNTRRYANQTL